MVVFCIHNDFQGTVCFCPKSSESPEWACFSPWGRKGEAALDPGFCWREMLSQERTWLLNCLRLDGNCLGCFLFFFFYLEYRKEDNNQNQEKGIAKEWIALPIHQLTDRKKWPNTVFRYWNVALATWDSHCCFKGKVSPCMVSQTVRGCISFEVKKTNSGNNV